jgi:hypothetical protein
MSEDITFCYNEKCKNRKCERHISHIKKNYIPHSFAFFMDCKYWDVQEKGTVPKKGDVNDGRNQ